MYGWIKFNTANQPHAYFMGYTVINGRTGGRGLTYTTRCNDNWRKVSLLFSVTDTIVNIAVATGTRCLVVGVVQSGKAIT